MDLSPWGIGAFVTGLVSVVIYGLRQMVVGRLVPGRLHDEVRADRDAYRAAAETSLKASAEMSSHVGSLTAAVSQLTAAVEQQAAAQRETLSLVRQIVFPGARSEVAVDPGAGWGAGPGRAGGGGAAAGEGRAAAFTRGRDGAGGEPVGAAG